MPASHDEARETLALTSYEQPTIIASEFYAFECSTRLDYGVGNNEFRFLTYRNCPFVSILAPKLM